jgi:hypothetical protein
MRRSDLPQLVEALRVPVEAFVHESRVRIALLVNGSGQVLAQHGFTRSYHVMNVASLAAATHASSRASPNSPAPVAGSTSTTPAGSGSSSWRRCARPWRS